MNKSPGKSAQAIAPEKPTKESKVVNDSSSAKSALDQELTFMGEIPSAPLNPYERPYEGPPETGNSFNGYPFVGQPSDFKEDDPEHLRPQAALFVHTKQFLTTDIEQLKEYNNVRQACAMHKVHILFEEKVYNVELKGWHILISWADKAYVAPKKRRD